MKVKIIRSNVSNEYYEQFIGKIFDISRKVFYGYVLRIPNSTGTLKETLWSFGEVEIVPEDSK